MLNKSICENCYTKTRNLVALPEEPKIKELKSFTGLQIICMKCLRKKYKGPLVGIDYV